MTQRSQRDARITPDLEEDGFRISDFLSSRTANDPAAVRIERQMRQAVDLYEFPEAWAVTRGAGIRIAIIDTGIDFDHPAFPDGTIVHWRRIIDGEASDRKSDVADDNGHGTHCAGIVAARPVPGVPFHGVAPAAQLLIYKCASSAGDALMSDVAMAIQDALENGVDIVSLSLRGEHPSDALYGAVHRLLAYRKKIICSAGNGGSIRMMNIGFPARYGGVITVAAHSRMGRPADFSSSGGEIDMSAPGEKVWSTWPGWRYKSMSGTSMAAPWVAGVSALIMSKHFETARAQRSSSGSTGAPPARTPILNNEDLREHLLRMCAHPGHHDSLSGYGPLLPGSYFRPVQGDDVSG